MEKVGAGMLKGSKHTAETRKKLSESHKGKPMLPQTRAALMKANKGGNKTSFKKGHVPWSAGKKLVNQQNDKNYAWKGEDVSYTGLHQWVTRYLGSPKKCSECGTETAPKYEWANVSKEYKRELNDWIRLCKACHMRFDGLLKPVVQKDLSGEVVKVWDCAFTAEKEAGFDSGHISKCCKRRPMYKTHKGFRWEYA